MWRNPKYADATPQAPPSTPEDNGHRLATLPRPDNRSGANSELRINLDNFQGHDYISVRLWQEDRESGAWWPTKKGTSIRISEIEDVCDALMSGLSLAQGKPEPTVNVSASEQRKAAARERRSRGVPAELPDACNGQPGFDEF